MAFAVFLRLRHMDKQLAPIIYVLLYNITLKCKNLLLIFWNIATI
jgi:hypothetical protein